MVNLFKCTGISLLYNADSDGYARVFIVNSAGNLNTNNVNNTWGVRPISFLKLIYLVKAWYSRTRIQD